MIIIYNLTLLTTLPSFADYQTHASNTKNHSEDYPIFYTYIIKQFISEEDSLKIMRFAVVVCGKVGITI